MMPRAWFREPATIPWSSCPALFRQCGPRDQGAGLACTPERLGNRLQAVCQGALLATDVLAGTRMARSRRAVPIVGQQYDAPASPPSDVAQGTGEAAQSGLRRLTPALDNRVGSIVGLLANRPCPGDPFRRCDARVELARSLSHAEELPAVGPSCLGLDPRLAKSAECRHRRSVRAGVACTVRIVADAIRRQRRPGDPPTAAPAIGLAVLGVPHERATDGARRAASGSPAVSGGRTVEPVTEEDV